MGDMKPATILWVSEDRKTYGYRDEDGIEGEAEKKNIKPLNLSKPKLTKKTTKFEGGMGNEATIVKLALRIQKANDMTGTHIDKEKKKKKKKHKNAGNEPVLLNSKMMNEGKDCAEAMNSTLPSDQVENNHDQKRTSEEIQTYHHSKEFKDLIADCYAVLDSEASSDNAKSNLKNKKKKKKKKKKRKKKREKTLSDTVDDE